MRLPISITLTLSIIAIIVSTGSAQMTFDEIRDQIEAEYEASGSTILYKQFKRLEHYLEYRLDTDGTVPNITKRHVDVSRRLAKRPTPMYNNQRAYSGEWAFDGPATIVENNGIGRINKIAFHPTDPDIIYVASAGGGLWRTTNHGDFWTPLTESLPVNNLQGVVVDYTDPDVIYIFTGDANGDAGGFTSSMLTKSSIGVLKSTNEGALWDDTGLKFDLQDKVLPYDLKMHPTDPSTLYASTNLALYKTDDGGITWDSILPGPIYDIEFNPLIPDMIYAVDTDRCHRSSDAGDTWPDWTAIPATDDGKTGRMELAVCESNSNYVYIIASPGDTTEPDHRGLWRSINQGLTFQMMSDTPNVLLDPGVKGSQGNYDLAIACNPLDEADVIVGAKGFYKSTDNGSSFAKGGGMHADIHTLVSSPLRNDTVYAGNDGGIYYSTDFGDNWTIMSYWLRITQYYDISVSQQDANTVIGGCQDNGTHLNIDSNNEFEQVLGKDGMSCQIHPMNDSMIIGSTQRGSFYLFREGDGWDMTDTIVERAEFENVATPVWVTPLAWDPTDTNNIYMGYKPILRSNDGGQTVHVIPDTIGGRRLLAVGTDDPDRLYAVDEYPSTVVSNTNITKFWTSDDGGDTWQRNGLDPSFPDSNYILSDIAINPDDAEEVWITVSGWDAAQKVYRSTNAGVTWQNMTGTLPNIPVNAIAYQDTDGSPDNAVYVGTDLGVFYRDDNLGDWIYFSNGLPKVEVTDLEITTDEGLLYAGTFGRGIWRSELFSACVSSYTLDTDNQPLGISRVYQASSDITSTAHVDGFGSEILYRAGDYTLLEEGFRAWSQNGAIFKAKAGGCTGGVD